MAEGGEDHPNKSCRAKGMAEKPFMRKDKGTPRRHWVQRRTREAFADRGPFVGVMRGAGCMGVDESPGKLVIKALRNLAQSRCATILRSRRRQ